MNFWQKKTIFLLRVAIGWLFLYSGFTKVMDPSWSAAVYLKDAQTLKPLFDFFASPENIGWVSSLNAWGQLLIGLALVTGVGVKIAAASGMLLMVLYYLPILNFPMVGKRSFLVDDHVIFFLVLLLLKKFDAGSYWGLKDQAKKLLPKNVHQFI